MSPWRKSWCMMRTLTGFPIKRQVYHYCNLHGAEHSWLVLTITHSSVLAAPGRPAQERFAVPCRNLLDGRHPHFLRHCRYACETGVCNAGNGFRCALTVPPKVARLTTLPGRTPQVRESLLSPTPLLGSAGLRVPYALFSSTSCPSSPLGAWSVGGFPRQGCAPVRAIADSQAAMWAAAVHRSTCHLGRRVTPASRACLSTSLQLTNICWVVLDCL